MLQQRVHNVARELAKKYNIPYQDMVKICDIPIEFLSHVMSTKVNREKVIFPSVRITGLGIFYCTDGRRRFFKKLNEKNKDNETT